MVLQVEEPDSLSQPSLWGAEAGGCVGFSVTPGHRLVRTPETGSEAHLDSLQRQASSV